MNAEPEATHDREPARRPIFRRLFGRRLRAGASVHEAVVVAIASGKGGTGKSFLASNVGVALAAKGRSITVVDADYGLGNAHLLLGVKPKQTIQHVLAGRAEVTDALVPTEFGFDLLPAGSGVRELANLGEGDLALLGSALGKLASQREVLLLDTGAGMAPPVLATLLSAQHVVLAIQPDLAALTDAYALIKCLSALEAPVEFHVVVNRVSQVGIGRATFGRLSEVSERFCRRPIHYLGEVPEDPNVGLRRLGQPPLLAGDPQCATSQALAAIADRIDQLVASTQGELAANDRLAARWARWAARTR